MKLSESIDLVNTILSSPNAHVFTAWLSKRGWDAQIQALSNAPTDLASNERYALWMEQQFHIWDTTQTINQNDLPPIIEDPSNAKRLAVEFKQYLKEKYPPSI